MAGGPSDTSTTDMRRAEPLFRRVWSFESSGIGGKGFQVGTQLFLLTRLFFGCRLLNLLVNLLQQGSCSSVCFHGGLIRSTGSKWRKREDDYSGEEDLFHMRIPFNASACFVSKRFVLRQVKRSNVKRRTASCFFTSFK